MCVCVSSMLAIFDLGLVCSEIDRLAAVIMTTLCALFAAYLIAALIKF